MNKSSFKNIKILKIMNNSTYNLPSPINISMWWNFGSLLGLCLMIQIISGIYLSMHYYAHTTLAFKSLIHIIQDVNYGWMAQLMHMNGASFFFLCLYLHIGRGIYYSSFKLTMPWIMGTLIFMLIMATAFMGYVLPWGQMSFWGATVITNLISTIPYMGTMIVEWIWGGFSVNSPTLTRFFTFHFIFPLISSILIIFHLMYLHNSGSTNPLGLNSNLNKINFHPYFYLKDLLGFLLLISSLLTMNFLIPYTLNDPENFTFANPMITPTHIQPEWYFLFAYTILRSIPNKLGGVMALLMSILILFFIPLFNKNKFQNLKFYYFNQLMFWIFTNNMIMLTWLGSQPVEPPFIYLSQISSLLYFSFYIINPTITKLWDKMIF